MSFEKYFTNKVLKFQKENVINDFVDKINGNSFPYQIVKCDCKTCSIYIVGDCENWPPRNEGICDVCDTIYCVECTLQDISRFNACVECGICFCINCKCECL